MLYICSVIRGFKYRIYPNKEQEQQLNQMLWNARFVYNWALVKSMKQELFLVALCGLKWGTKRLRKEKGL